jgi:hypothetical protein
MDDDRLAVTRLSHWTNTKRIKEDDASQLFLLDPDQPNHDTALFLIPTFIFPSPITTVL